MLKVYFYKNPLTFANAINVPQYKSQNGISTH